VGNSGGGQGLGGEGKKRRKKKKQPKGKMEIPTINNPTQSATPPVSCLLSPVSLSSAGVALDFRQVTVRAGERTILQEIDLTIRPGEQVAIVGASGAGKSSLVGLLLGWRQPAKGALFVDGGVLTGERLPALRQMTAWVDPAVQIWNRSLMANLRYGSPEMDGAPLGQALDLADLYGILEKLPQGLQMALGEGGGLVSGGEGQRVRLGRALLRPGVRLAILDEPFRGLDRRQRQRLLANARRHWQGATLLCVTHDVGETQRFDRVLVMEQGRLLEDGPPATLAAQPQSRYHALLAAEESVQQELWQGGNWRRLWLQEGQLQETTADQQPVAPTDV